ncbi:MAG: T9SS type A sorting domain-containing protein [Clostridia bacterium]|nr:T9SS type A sorting domain-containing protein [Clostridia bacterium]
MKKIALLLVMFGCLHLSAQTSFFEIFTGTNSINYPFDMLVKPNENIVFTVNSIDINSFVYANEIYEFSPEGEIINHLTICDSSSHWETFTHLFFIEDTLFVIGWGKKLGQEEYPYLLLKKIDSNMQEINSYEMRFNMSAFLVGMYAGQVKFINNKFVYLSATGATNSFPFYAEITREGEITRFEIDNQPDGTKVPYDFMQLQDTSGYQTYSFWYDLTGSKIGGYMVDYDNEMNIIRRVKIPEIFFSFFTHVPISDTTFYLSGLWMDYATTTGKKAGVLKMNTGAEVTKSFLYMPVVDSSAGPAYRHSLEMLPDGNLIFCCTDNIVLELGPQPYPTRISLFKLTPDLKVLWHRFLGTEDAKYDAYVMRTTPNEEIVILGAYSLAPPPNNWVDQDILFIKTDKHGLITGTNDALHEISSTEAIVFPNPAHDVVYVEYSLAYASATFMLTDISGKTMLEKTLVANKANIDISSLPAGTYVYRIANADGLNESGKIVKK